MSLRDRLVIHNQDAVLYNPAVDRKRRTEDCIGAVSYTHLKSALNYPDIRNTDTSWLSLDSTLDVIEGNIIEKILLEENMNFTKAAKRLGINRSTLWRKRRDLNIDL